MPTAFHYASTLHRLARLSGDANPPHVRFRAAAILVGELSPLSPRRELVRRMLQEANPFELARHKLRDLYGRPGSLCPPLPLGEGWGEGSAPLEEEPPEEDADPL